MDPESREARARAKQSERQYRRPNWWLFGNREATSTGARSASAIHRDSETSKHRFFVFLDATILPDNMLVNIALQDAFFLGVLSSRIHVTWALGSRRQVGSRQRSSLQQDAMFRPVPISDLHRGPERA